MVQYEAVYAGVHNYGSENVNKDTIEQFQYRFLIDGKEVLLRIDPGETDEDGDYLYPIQNLLKEDYDYVITVDDDVVVAVEEVVSAGTSAFSDFHPAVKGKPGLKTLGNFLKTAMEPVGWTLYIYGGGWNWQDKGASIQASSLGVSSDWVRFFLEQDENYTYKSKDGDENYSDPATSYYPYGRYNEYYYAGLDCSGYVGWTLYNTFESQNGLDGYVTYARRYAKMLSEMGYGTWFRESPAPESSDQNEKDPAPADSDQTERSFAPDGSGQTGRASAPAGSGHYVIKPGDIVSTAGHVWISLGTCSDGSIVILHSTPAMSRTGQPGGGVELSAIGTSEECEAYQLADRYMSAYYPEWYDRYPVKLADQETYLSFAGEDTGIFSWDIRNGTLRDSEGTLSDPDGTPRHQNGTFSDPDGTHRHQNGTFSDPDGTPRHQNGTFRDPDGISEMTPEEVLAFLFEN